MNYVGLCVEDPKTNTHLSHAIRAAGATPRLFHHTNHRRWELLIAAVKHKNIVCVIDDNPDMVINATALGIDGVIYDLPKNRYFSWHLRAAGVDDARLGLAYIMHKWNSKLCIPASPQVNAPSPPAEDSHQQTAKVQGRRRAER